jgi:hypothetical protein
LEHGRHARSSEKSHWPGLERLAKDCPEFRADRALDARMHQMRVPQKQRDEAGKMMSVTGKSIR